MLASVIAGLAEGELEAIRERTRASRAKLRDAARWPGGKPPYGYRAVPRTDGAGWSLEIDPESSRIVRRIVESVLDDVPMNQVATALNAEGVLTPGDYYRGGTTGGRWSTTPIRNMLRSKALRGYAHHKGETIRDDDGLPVRLADPLVNDDEWTLLQAALDKAAARFTNAKRAAASPLSGLVTCAVCGSTLHFDGGVTKGRFYGYYRCPNRDTTQLKAKDLETIVAEEFLDQLADVEVRERVWVPGDDHEAELREAVTAYDELTSAAGRAQSKTAKQRLQRQLDTLDARIAELESAPAREARYEWRATGETYGAVWAAADADQRRELLAKSGIRLSAAITGVEGKRSPTNMGAFQFHLFVPEEITEAIGGGTRMTPTSWWSKGR
jgi:site-specific DNA recombinase